MQLTDYLQRIGYTGLQAPNYTTLRQLHRAHLLAIPYENLDIHLGRPLTLDLDPIYTKLVDERRGGWCYEMNGLFAWALREVGFDVTLLGSSVGAPAKGAEDLDHLVLLVQLEQPWLVDVGFGNGFLEPLPLRAGNYQQHWLTYQLEQQADDKWYFHNQQHSTLGYGFTLQPHHLPGFASRCHELQTSPTSGFVRRTVCHRFVPGGIVALRGAVLNHYSKEGVLEEEINSLQRYRTVFAETFGLDSALADSLWDTVWQQHLAWKQTLSEANTGA